VRSGKPSAEDESVIENWRASHAYVLNTFQATLRRHVKGNEITIAQRLKRRHTIFDKLTRQPGMRLARMHDLAGCRLIFDDEESLHRYRAKIHKSRFKHKMKNEVNDYDYLSNPKNNGYRGVHDVYSYVPYKPTAENWRGLLIELQYRTKIQHAWATAVEIAGSLTGNEPKFDRGDALHQEYFRFSSELLSRKFENRYGPIPNMTSTDILNRWEELDRQTHLTRILDGMHYSTKRFENARNLILIIRGSELEIFGFSKTTAALTAYNSLEQGDSDADIVLVRSDTGEGIRSAFRNYFSDARDFVRLLGEAVADPPGDLAADK